MRTIPINLKRNINSTKHKSSSPSFSNTIEAYINLSNIYIDRIIYSRKKKGNFSYNNKNNLFGKNLNKKIHIVLKIFIMNLLNNQALIYILGKLATKSYIIKIIKLLILNRLL
jgi:hypothetical protein